MKYNIIKVIRRILRAKQEQCFLIEGKIKYQTLSNKLFSETVLTLKCQCLNYRIFLLQLNICSH